MGVKIVGYIFDEIKASNQSFVSKGWTMIEWTTAVVPKTEHRVLKTVAHDWSHICEQTGSQ